MFSVVMSNFIDAFGIKAIETGIILSIGDEKLLCDVLFNEHNSLGGRHFVDIIGDISWTKEVTFRGHFW